MRVSPHPAQAFQTVIEERGFTKKDSVEGIFFDVV
jgi:hypothetical protein